MRSLVGVMRSLVLGLVVLLGVAACSTTPAVVMAPEAVVVDVRTPAEFAEGHLEGALNIDLQSGSFEQQIGALPTDGSYVVYCRSGNRSAQAAGIMAKLGLEQVVDAGGLQSAAQVTGLPIVTGE
ncbi:MAG: rhodanese-like domain-containing protein [Propionibacteriaceae bacterium]|nr:rhodanese-like domain-containing protein [Propionibacteriaceae bacterium]